MLGHLEKEIQTLKAGLHHLDGQVDSDQWVVNECNSFPEQGFEGLLALATACDDACDQDLSLCTGLAAQSVEPTQP